MHLPIIAHWARYHKVGGVRTVCETDTKGLMSPVYVLMRCVDNALIGQWQGSDGGGEHHDMVDQTLPDKEGAHLT